MSACKTFEGSYSAFVDEELGRDERAAVVAHLDECAACRGVVADLEQLRAAARMLGPVAPPAHLWLEVAGQIRLDQTRTPSAAWPVRRRAALGQWLGLAAALVLATLGVYLVGVSRSPNGGDTSIASGTGSVDTVAQELTIALEHYDKAIAELQVIARKDEGVLDPTVALTLQRNLSLIDRAIVDSRAALKRQPDSEPARETLLDALQRKIGVLQTTVALVNEMRKGDAAGAARVIGGKS